MERESLTGLLFLILGGGAVQLCAWWPCARVAKRSPVALERRSWWALWCPIWPALAIAAWLCGWALGEPDPVRDRLGPLVLCALGAPFGLLLARALARAAWALLDRRDDAVVSTVGLVNPRIVFSPYLARQLDVRLVDAALEHERAHVRHWDPLRIWVAQFVSDLQWPWPGARRRLEHWLTVLERSRDEEARARGVDGADLAAAVLATVRFACSSASRQARHGLLGMPDPAGAGLISQGARLRQRIDWLLQPPASAQGAFDEKPARVWRRRMLLLIPVLLAFALGVVFGQRLIAPLLALTA